MIRNGFIRNINGTWRSIEGLKKIYIKKSREYGDDMFCINALWSYETEENSADTEIINDAFNSKSDAQTYLDNMMITKE